MAKRSWNEVPVEEYFTTAVAEEQPVPVAENVTVHSCQLVLINGYVLILRRGSNDFRLADFTAWRRAKVYEMPFSEFEALPKPQAFDLEPQILEAVWRAGVFNSSLLNENVVRDAVRFFDVDANKVIEIIKRSY